MDITKLMDLIYHGGFQDQEPPFFIEFLQEAFFLYDNSCIS